MKSSLYISSEKIELIGYETSAKQVTIKEYFSMPLPEGTMLGGKITEPSQLTACLLEIKAQRPQLLQNPTLVVEGNFLLSKKLNVPKMKRMKYVSLIADEFADAAERPEDIICDYHILRNTSGEKISILAFATEKATVASYIAVFEEANIKLQKIRIGVQAVLHFLEERAEYQEGSFVLNIIEGVSMLSMVFVNGVNVFMSRTRLYYENTEALARTLAEILSGLMQFNRSQQLEEIRASYYMGLSPEELEFLKEYNPHYGVEVAPFDLFQDAVGTHKLAAQTHFAYLAIWLPENSMDFLHSYRKKKKLKKSGEKREIRPLLAGGLAALLAAPILVFAVNNALMNGKIEKLNEYINDPVIQEKTQELDALSEKMAYWGAVQSQVSQKETQNAALIPLSDVLLDMITQTNAANVRVNLVEYEEDTAKMTVSGNASTEKDSAAFVESLKHNAMVESVQYTGYSYVTDESRDFNFTIEVKFLIKGSVE